MIDGTRLERGFAASLSDLSYGVNDLFAVEDRVVLRAAIRAIHTGEFYGVDPTDRRVIFTAIVIYRIFGGKIAESWGELDFLGLFRQLRST
jgi:predicted ester cyclase